MNDCITPYVGEITCMHMGRDVCNIYFWIIFFQVLQEDLEQEQVRVNSLTHMVVVVDESSGDHATAALEERLKVRFLKLNMQL